MADPADPRILDRSWRSWANLTVIAIALTGALLGVLIIPVVQGRSVGIDTYTAICRALGILPGSPAQQQVVSRNPPTPVSQVVWTPDVLHYRGRQARTWPRQSIGGVRGLPWRKRRVNFS
jgi:hypothetical protein